METLNFSGLRVVAFESRRADEMAKLIEHHKGVATVAPSMREVPLEHNPETLAFEQALLANELDMVIFLTGVGVRLLAREIEARIPRERWTEALKRTAIIARGPKPVAALKEFDVPVTLRVDEPNTWREIIEALDEREATLPLKNRRVAVQEYGMINRNLLVGLHTRGANVLRVPVYKWALPEDTGPLRAALEDIIEDRFDVALFTAGIQMWHLFKLAGEMGMENELREGLRRLILVSIGPATSETFAELELVPDLTPEHPKMGHLVRHAAIHSRAALESKRALV